MFLQSSCYLRSGYILNVPTAIKVQQFSVFLKDVRVSLVAGFVYSHLEYPLGDVARALDNILQFKSKLSLLNAACTIYVLCESPASACSLSFSLNVLMKKGSYSKRKGIFTIATSVQVVNSRTA